MNRRLLLVSYHFPPSEAAGALRWQRLAPIAARRGWDVDVISLAREQLSEMDERRLAELPAAVHLHEVPAGKPAADAIEHGLWRLWRLIRPKRSPAEHWERSRTFKTREDLRDLRWSWRKMLRIWNTFMGRQRELAWVRPAVRAGLRIGARHRPDLVISCGPPHQVHEAGRRLARALGTRFVMDMRDTWTVEITLAEDLASPLWFSLAERDEARCVAEASLIVMNTPLAAAAMQQRYPGKPVISVLNGWDDEPLVEAPWSRQFRMVYAGTIYLDRTPEPLFRAVAAAIRQLGIGPSEFEVRFIGSTQEAQLRSLALQHGIGDFVRLLPRMNRAEILQEYAQAAVLLSLPQGLHYAIPSKLYEYIRQPAWVVVQSDPTSASAGLLRDSPAFVVSPDNVQEMATILVSCYQDFKAGRRPLPVAQDGQWSRAREAEKLFRALETIS